MSYDNDNMPLDADPQEVAASKRREPMLYRGVRHGARSEENGRFVSTELYDWDVLSLLIRKSVALDSGCWEWSGYKNKNGYGATVLKGKKLLAHRVSYTYLRGPIPTGLVLDHLCRNHACVNPDHLEPVTHAENMRRWSTSITKCTNGHEYTDSNTYIDPSGGKRCRECNRLRAMR